MINNTNTGEVGNMVIANGLSQLYTGARDVDPYSAFDDVLDADGGVVDIDFSEFRSGASRRARSQRGKSRGRRPINSERREKLRRASNYLPPVAIAKGIKRASDRNQRRKDAGEGGAFQRFGQSVKGGIERMREQRNKEAQQQQALIAQAQASAPTAEQLNALLAPSTATVQTQQTATGMSPTLKWGLIIGGVAIAGVAGYLIYKKMKNKTK